MAAPQKRQLPYHVVNGFRLPFRFSSKRFEDAISYNPLPGEIFLGSYPKTGSTWLQYIVYLIVNDGERANDVASLLASTPYVQRDGFQMKGSSNLATTKPIALKYQVPFSYVPYSERAKYIYMSRNPKDTCVSFYHFCKTVPGYRFEDGTFDEFLNIFMSGDMPFGDYTENLMSWYEHEDEPNFLFLTFEAMKDNIKDSIVKIANFLNHDIKPDVVNKIVNYSSVDYMKRHMNSHLGRYLDTSPDSFDLRQLKMDDSKATTDSSTPRVILIRKGDVGQWKYYFSREQSIAMNKQFKEKTKGTPVEHLWPEIMTDTTEEN